MLSEKQKAYSVEGFSSAAWLLIHNVLKIFTQLYFLRLVTKTWTLISVDFQKIVKRNWISLLNADIVFAKNSSMLQG